ncbi:hypothetical protein CVT24_001350 [Panaeolus cyanescens]|uniref:Uncharacterized protein n=1 Tax=Panaeolus cyanescens TaxID=181874 RepID=A0A409YFV5_9AGAR|nr:hypothetical protein CVT24_001350 [Panaeolus cyanescens]
MTEGPSPGGGFQDPHITMLLHSLGDMSVQDISNTHPQPADNPHESHSLQHESLNEMTLPNTKRARQDTTTREPRQICKVKVVGNDHPELRLAIAQLNQQLETITEDHQDTVQSLFSAHSTIQTMYAYTETVHELTRTLHDEKVRLSMLLRSSGVPLTTKIYLEKAVHAMEVDITTRPLHHGDYHTQEVPTHLNAEPGRHQDGIALLRSQIQTLVKALTEERRIKAAQSDEIARLERNIGEKGSELSSLKDNHAKDMEEMRKRVQEGLDEWDGERRVFQAIIARLEEQLSSQKGALKERCPSLRNERKEGDVMALQAQTQEQQNASIKISRKSKFNEDVPKMHMALKDAGQKPTPKYRGRTKRKRPTGDNSDTDAGDEMDKQEILFRECSSDERKTVRLALYKFLGIKNIEDAARLRTLSEEETTAHRDWAMMSTTGDHPICLRPYTADWDEINGPYNHALFSTMCKEVTSQAFVNLLPEKRSHLFFWYLTSFDQSRALEKAQRLGGTIENEAEYRQRCHKTTIAVEQRDRRNIRRYIAHDDRLWMANHYLERAQLHEVYPGQVQLYENMVGTVKKLGPDGMSSDESDPENPGIFKAHKVLWRSPGVDPVLRFLDKGLSMKSDVPSTFGRPHVSERVYTDTPSQRVVVPSEKPVNFYDEVALQTLPLAARRRVMEDPHDVYSLMAFEYGEDECGQIFAFPTSEPLQTTSASD